MTENKLEKREKYNTLMQENVIPMHAKTNLNSRIYLNLRRTLIPKIQKFLYSFLRCILDVE